AWRAGQRSPERSGERWCEVITNWPCLEHVIADGGQGLERGVKLANAVRCAQSKAPETASSQALTMGLDVFHTQRELERILQRQWKQAERHLKRATSDDVPGTPIYGHRAGLWAAGACHGSLPRRRAPRLPRCVPRRSLFPTGQSRPGIGLALLREMCQ